MCVGDHDSRARFSTRVRPVQAFTVSELTNAGTVLTPAIVATNPEQAQFLVYSIESGDQLDPGDASKGAAFTVGTYNGKLTVAGKLDHELKGSYALSVKVTDNGSPVCGVPECALACLPHSCPFYTGVEHHCHGHCYRWGRERAASDRTPGTQHC